MFLSRVEIDVYNRRKLKALTHVGAYHNWVEQSFPDEVAHSIRTRKLWRIDEVKGKKYLLVLSQNKPDIKLLECYGVANTAATKDYDTFLNQIQQGQRMRFRVVLNPVISLSNKEGKRGNVKPHITLDYQMQFFLERTNKNGFKVNSDEVAIVEREFVPYRRQGQKLIRLSKVAYEGILEVIDRDIFKRILVEGYGKKKAYGFGLMTVIPIEK